MGTASRRGALRGLLHPLLRLRRRARAARSRSTPTPRDAGGGAVRSYVFRVELRQSRAAARRRDGASCWARRPVEWSSDSLVALDARDGDYAQQVRTSCRSARTGRLVYETGSSDERIGRACADARGLQVPPRTAACSSATPSRTGTSPTRTRQASSGSSTGVPRSSRCSTVATGWCAARCSGTGWRRTHRELLTRTSRSPGRSVGDPEEVGDPRSPWVQGRRAVRVLVDDRDWPDAGAGGGDVTRRKPKSAGGAHGGAPGRLEWREAEAERSAGSPSRRRGTPRRRRRWWRPSPRSAWRSSRSGTWSTARTTTTLTLSPCWWSTCRTSTIPTACVRASPARCRSAGRRRRGRRCVELPLHDRLVRPPAGPGGGHGRHRHHDETVDELVAEAHREEHGESRLLLLLGLKRLRTRKATEALAGLRDDPELGDNAAKQLGER